MFANRSAGLAAGILAVIAMLYPVGASHAQQGWPINHPTGSSSFPWNSPGYRGYSEPQYRTQRISPSAASGQPEKYELNVNALPIMKNTQDENTLTLVAHVPENAQIWVGDSTTTSTGTLRTFTSPALTPGSTYTYAVRVAWMEEGKPVSQSHTFSFKPGDVHCVYLVVAGSKLEGEKNSGKTSLAKLNPEDRKLAEAQSFCAVQNGVRLGAMGTPTKLILKGEPVFLCCDACRERAQSNPDATLGKAKELKAKAKAPASK